jgi:hypothetical protein
VKQELCRAFCSELDIRDVPAGLAVSTAFNWFGEPLGFYIVGPDANGRYRLEDDGTTMPLIEAEGAGLDSQTRAAAFDEMLEEYGASYNEARAELTTVPLSTDDIPRAAMRFVALLLRLQDMVLLTPERVASTFREDAAAAIRKAVGDRALIRERESIAPGIEFPADLILSAPNRVPDAVFLASTEQRVLEAVVAQMAVLYESNTACSVIALLEKDTSISRKMRKHAANRLTAMPIFEGEEGPAVARIEREVLGFKSAVH